MSLTASSCFLSVLIPAYNEEGHIGRAVASVKASLAAAAVSDYEIVVCDNNSSDATGKLAGEAGARVVFEPHNQIARARNAAARAAKGGWFIFMDADSELSSALIEATLLRIRNQGTGAGGALVDFDRKGLPWHVEGGLRFWNAISRTIGWAAGSYLFCRREGWEETGGFDEDWYAAEEIVFSRSLKRWCRKRALRFEIITESRLRTSARKIDSYSFWRLLGLLGGLARPGALKSRTRCRYWYQRNSGPESLPQDCGGGKNRSN